MCDICALKITIKQLSKLISSTGSHLCSVKNGMSYSCLSFYDYKEDDIYNQCNLLWVVILVQIHQNLQ